MMSPYLPPNTSSYLDSSSEGVCGSIVGVNGGSGPPGSHHSNHPPPPHMVSQGYDRYRFIYIHSLYESVQRFCNVCLNLKNIPFIFSTAVLKLR